MRDCNIIISTVERPNKTPYLDSLIASIQKEYDGVINLVIGGDPTYTKKYDGDRRISKYHIWEEEKKLPSHRQRAALGYYTALKLYSAEKSALILEDDGILEKGWSIKLKMLKTYIPYEKYMLSLISPSRESVSEPDSKVPSVQYYKYQAMLSYDKPGQLPSSTIITYSNTTGIYYPSSILKTRLAEFIYEYAVEGDAYYDIVVGQFMFRYQLPIYITVPDLVKNVGEGVEGADSSLGSEKQISHVDYSKWDFTQL